MISEQTAGTIQGHVDLDEVVDLTAGMANIPSFSGDEGAVAAYVARRMRELGFDEVELQEAEPGRPNVIGTIRGDGSGLRLMFNGHLDIDPVPIGYDRPLWETSIEDGWMYGVGIGNMKAADAAMIMAAVAVKRSGVPLKGDIVVACVVGELQGGVGTAWLLDHGPIPDVAIVPEPTNLQIRTMHAGVLEFLLSVYRKPTSAKGGFAIDRALAAMKALHNLEFNHTPFPELPGLPRVNAGSMLGEGVGPGDGGARTMLSRGLAPTDSCTIAFDMRLHPDMTEEGAVADLRACIDAVADGDPDHDYVLEFPPAAYKAPWRAMGLFMPPLNIPKDHPLVAITARHHEAVTGEAPSIGMHMPGSYAGADSGHLWRRGIPCFNYGPTQHSRFYHQVELSRLEQGTKVLALTAADVCSQSREALGYPGSWL